jgi:GT2 family glycosyltransferase
MSEYAENNARDAELLTAVICTCNRGDTVLMALRSLLASTYPDFEVLVIDQSTDDRTFDAVQPFRSDARFRYVRSQSKGLGKSHNIAMEEARSDIVVITDDDCEAPPDWLAAMSDPFRRMPEVAVVYCSVEAAPHDAEAGFIPAYHCDAPRLLTRPSQGPGGIGAGMAVRRSHVLALGGFDDRLGPGAPFPSGDEQDLSARALLRGFHVYVTNETHTMHYGYRTWEEGRQLTRRDCRAAGAVAGKLFRSGHFAMMWSPVRVLWAFVGLLWLDAKKLRRPRGVARITSFVRGFVQGLRAPIDRATLRFTDTTEASA